MDWRYNTIWFDELNEGKFYHQNYKGKTRLPDSFTDVEYAILWYYKQKGISFGNLAPSKRLLYLELNWANIKDFQAIEKFENPKRLELHYCTKLEIDTGLKSLNNTLEFLHINQSKKFVLTDELLQLKQLKVLCLNSCGPIDNLKFLSNFPKLIDFRFANTNIIDGDLTPILEHPTIRTVGYLNKRHYNFTDIQLESELSSKSTKEFESFVYKGEYQTFRYDYE